MNTQRDISCGNISISSIARTGPSRSAKICWEPNFPAIEPQINEDGVHVWPFNAEFPIDLRSFSCTGGNLRMNQHDYCELIYIYSGTGEYQVQGRSFQVHPGDLIVVGRSVFHRLFWPPQARGRVMVLFFQPKLITTSDNVESA